jgi:thioredoxin
MKKLSIVFLLAIGFMVTSCNQTEEAKAETKVEGKSTEQVVKKADPNDVQPMQMTSQGFIDEIWDYKSNPEEWVFKSDLPVVVDFYADWCKPCKMVAPIMDDLADYYKGRVKFYKVNTDQNREISSVFQIRSIPSILFAPKVGQPSMQKGAMSKEQYIKIIDEYVLKIKK